jgi:hypothetical protein
MLANFSDEALIIPKVTDLGIAAGIFEILVKNKRQFLSELVRANQTTAKEKERNILH